MREYDKKRFKVGTPEIRKTAYGDVLDYVGGPYIPYPDYEDLKGFIAILSEAFELYDGSFGGEYSDLQLGSQEDCGCRYDCSCNPTIYISGVRELTQIERDFFDKKEAARKEKKKERDRAEYERLKKEFERK